MTFWDRWVGYWWSWLWFMWFELAGYYNYQNEFYVKVLENDLKIGYDHSISSRIIKLCYEHDWFEVLGSRCEFESEIVKLV